MMTGAELIDALSKLTDEQLASPVCTRYPDYDSDCGYTEEAVTSVVADIDRNHPVVWLEY